MKKRYLEFFSIGLTVATAVSAMPARVSAAQAHASQTRKPAAKAKSSVAISSAANSDSYIAGFNVRGRTGLFFSDTAEAPAQGAAAVTGHLLIGSGSDVDTIDLPVGFSYGLAPNFELSGSLDFESLKLDVPAGVDGSRSGLNTLTVGGKFVVPVQGNVPINVAGAMDISHGPLSSDLGGDGTDVDFKGIGTFTIMPQKILVNGEAGIVFAGSRETKVHLVNPVTGAVTTVKVKSDSDIFLHVSGGVGYMLKPTLMGIAELGINELGKDNGVFALGLRGRASKALTWQGFLALGLNDNPSDIMIGGGLSQRF